jgi:adenylate cyclase
VRGFQLEHRPAVLMAADVVGYSRLMGRDEEGTLAALKAVRRDVVDGRVDRYRGRILREMGDGLLVEFDSARDAVACATDIQHAMPRHGTAVPADRRIRFRIAVHLGDIVSDGETIHGDAVNVAAGMESLAHPGGINVSRVVRDEVGESLPIAFEDIGEHAVKNAPLPVHVYRIVVDDAKPAAVNRRASAATPAKPALAVLPFQNLSGDAEAEYFLDSVVEDLVTELARARWFSVIARNSSFTYKGKGADSKQVGRELGARYVVEGSLRKAGSRVRIGCQLVEAASGRHLWADRFDGTLDDTFDLQDRIAESVIGSVEPVLRVAEVERARGKPEAELDVYELTRRALPTAFAETADDNEEALRLLTQALGMHPDYPTANALAAWSRLQRHLMNWPGMQLEDREEAKRLARRAIAGGADVPLALAIAGAVRAALTRDHDLALAAVDRAVAMNPNAAIVLGFDALTQCLCGAYREAIAHAEKALGLNPFEPLVYHAELALALADLLTGRAEEAVVHGRKAIEGNQNFAFSWCVVVLGLARLGRADEAREAIRGLVRAAPRFRLSALRSIRFADAARLHADLDLLRSAHFPE